MAIATVAAVCPLFVLLYLGRVKSDFFVDTKSSAFSFNSAQKAEVATFAANWFWGPDARFGAEKGILRTRVGYTGGKTRWPTYHSL